MKNALKIAAVLMAGIALFYIVALGPLAVGIIQNCSIKYGSLDCGFPGSAGI